MNKLAKKKLTNRDSTTTTIVTKYTYDAWGACTIIEDTSGCGISTINPYRYRSYYFDPEIGLYYLQSRYYNPVVGRFLNADESRFLGIDGGVLGYNLFSYCLNNIVMNKDPSGRWIVYSEIKRLLYTYIVLRFGVAFANYIYNSNTSRDIKSGYINGQGKGKVSKLRFGAFKMSYNGCEVIAVYNALRMKGKGIPISQIALEMEVNGSSLLYGIFGANPYFIGNYFGHHNIKYTRYTSESKMKNSIKNGIYIISFWNNQKITGGIHTVAFNYKNGLYTVYNDSDNNTKSKSYRSLTAIYSGGRFIVGYYLS